MTLTISNDFFQEIGRIAVLQSHIEGGLAIVITNLAGVETRVGDALTKPLSFRALSQIAFSLLKLREKEIGGHGEEAAALIRRSCDAEARRNEIVHSMWSFGPDFDPQVVSRLKLSGTPPALKGHAVSIEDVRAIVAEMEEILAGIVYIHPFLRAQSGRGRDRGPARIRPA
jgi:hypothetical protein